MAGVSQGCGPPFGSVRTSTISACVFRNLGLELFASQELAKLGKKLDFARQTAKLAADRGDPTSGVLIRCLRFVGDSVSAPVAFQLAEPNGDVSSYFMQLGWTTDNEVVLRVTPQARGGLSRGRTSFI